MDHDHPKARNLGAVVTVARQPAAVVASQLEAGRLPLVAGGDCTITLGVIAGFRRHYSDVGLVYADGDADLSTPDSGGSGIFDSMGVAHLLGHGAAELAGLDGPPPLLQPARLAIVGSDPRETGDAGRRFLAQAGSASRRRPRSSTTRPAPPSRRWPPSPPESGPAVVHFDVDMIDSGDLPLGNFPHYGSGVRLDHAVALLRALTARGRGGRPGRGGRYHVPAGGGGAREGRGPPS